MADVNKELIKEVFVKSVGRQWKASEIAKQLDMPKATVNKVLYANVDDLWSKSDDTPPKWSWIDQSSSKIQLDSSQSTVPENVTTCAEGACIVQAKNVSVEQPQQGRPTEDQVDKYFVMNDCKMAPKIVARRLGYTTSEHIKQVKRICYTLHSKRLLQGISGPGDTLGTFGEFITKRPQATSVDDLQNFVNTYNATQPSTQWETQGHPEGLTYIASLTLTLPNVEQQFKACTSGSRASTRDALASASYELLRKIQQHVNVPLDTREWCRRTIANGHERLAQHTFGQPYYMGAEGHFVEYKGTAIPSEPMSEKIFRKAFNDHCGKFLTAVWNTLYLDNERDLIKTYPFNSCCIVFGVHDSEVIQGIAFEGDSFERADAARKSMLDDRKRKLNRSLEDRVQPESAGEALKKWVKMDFTLVASKCPEGGKFLYILKVYLPVDNVPDIHEKCTWNEVSYRRDGAELKKVHTTS
eukprot:m.1638511 g.1638511  ORF g.1638511 m.1638511 type:complete len:469 (+) comp28426_c0_seq1:290-1696(+)